MLQIHNHTPFAAERALLRDPRGAQIWVVAVKATYQIADSGDVALADQQEPVCAAPEFQGAPGASSLRRETELTLHHPGTDVTLNATAHALAGRATPSLDVAVEVAGLHKRLAVVGDRVWSMGPVGLHPSEPEPFVSMPIVYERAFGGAPVDEPDAAEPRNPVGVGFAPSESLLDGRPLPNVEDMDAPIRAWNDRPAPAGFGAVAAHWSPRRELAGTFDDAWKRTQAPFWPEDHDPLYYRSAPPGLWSERPLRGGERVATVGLTPAGNFGFRIPYEALLIESRVAGQRVAHSPPQLDRVIVDVDERRLLLVWSSRLACGTRGREIEFTMVDRKERLR